MKFSGIAFITLLVALFSATEAQHVGKAEGVNTVRKLKKNKSRKNNSGPTKSEKAEKRREEIIGDCSELSGRTLTFDTDFKTNEKTVLAFPCSTGYLSNHAANRDLLKDARKAINDAGAELGLEDVDCYALCDIDNNSYVTEALFGKDSIEDEFDNADVFCDADDGILQQITAPSAFNTGNDGTLSACRCDETESIDGADPVYEADKYVAGCERCSGTVSFTLGICYSSADFAPEVATKAPGKTKTEATKIPKALGGDIEDEEEAYLDFEEVVEDEEEEEAPTTRWFRWF